MLNTWLLLFGAIVLEVAGTTSMKLSYGFTRLIPSIMIFVFYGASFTLLNLALKKMAVSVAYTIWAGLGTALVAVIGIVYFKENVNVIKVLGLCLVIGGIVVINNSGIRH